MKTILIVDDDRLYRTVLSRILSAEYLTLEAANGEEALALLEKHAEDISAIMLDLIMPLMDGFGFLQKVSENPAYANIPILVASSNKDNESEKVALKLGAWDFVSKPYDPEIIRFRIKNAIERSQLSAYQRLKYLAEYDTLTGIYNKSKFFMKTMELLHMYREKEFVFIRCDIDKFQLVNSFYGTEEGDKLLNFFAEKIKEFAESFEFATYGRIEGDIFGICVPYEKAKIREGLKKITQSLQSYNSEYTVICSYGLYIIDDYEASVDLMFDRASLAAKKCKGNYMDEFAVYDEKLSHNLVREQEIINSMNAALQDGQFIIYIQPKYDLNTKTPVGGEALVRWKLPDGSMNSPAEFIPVFEKNGFITKLDLYVWEEVCIIIRKWLDEGKKVSPISVNISRVDLYNPRLAETLIELTEKYEIPPQLFNLELTESAYIDNPTAMAQTMMKLQKKGFVIMMDDFGSGYSSLNFLKDINVDVLKIDMKFLSNTAIPGRGENIIASVVRMAKWLNIPVVAEGVETKQQADFLHSIGCEYCQGYYFAKPMPIQEYEKLLDEGEAVCDEEENNEETFVADSLWALNPQMEMLFNSMPQAIAVYEFDGENIELLRVNKNFEEVIGMENFYFNTNNIMNLCHEDYRERLLSAFKRAVETQKDSECEYLRRKTDGSWIWVSCKLKYISRVGERHTLFANLMDITAQKEMDKELRKYKVALSEEKNGPETVLIVDDMALGRAVIKDMFSGKYNILEACNGKDALRVLEEHNNKVDLILLDLVMPEMDGKAFLHYKNSVEEIADIPVIVITSENREEEQVKLLEIGASDYIIKPFVKEILRRRVDNVLTSNKRLRLKLKNMDKTTQQSRIDWLSGIYTSNTAVKIISGILGKSKPDEKHALIILDLKDFKEINRKFGHLRGNEVLSKTGHILCSMFDRNGIVARMEDDEFIAFIDKVDSADEVVRDCQEICDRIQKITVSEHGEAMSAKCSIGASIFPDDGEIFLELYKYASQALAEAKESGENQFVVYKR